MSTEHMRDVASRATQKFADDFFKELNLKKGGPVLHLLACAKAEATEALVGLINCDLSDTENTRRLQNRARLYFDMIEWTSKSIHAAEQAYQLMKMDEAYEMKQAILTQTGDATMSDD